MLVGKASTDVDNAANCGLKRKRKTPDYEYLEYALLKCRVHQMSDLLYIKIYKLIYNENTKLRSIPGCAQS
jgi:hypothetical protein